MNRQSGQTLIETTVGIFILIVGISSAVGLATYSLNSTSNVTKQLIATGLAREGIEAARNMRDTNWLKGTIASSCYNYTTTALDAYCYTNWLSSFYNFDGAPIEIDSHTVDFLPTVLDNQQYWDFDVVTSTAPNRYRVYYDADLSDGRLYTSLGGTNDPTDFYREVILQLDTTAPYYQASIGPRIKVTSRVWWLDKNCQPPLDSWSESKPACRVELVGFLTNWRNY